MHDAPPPPPRSLRPAAPGSVDPYRWERLYRAPAWAYIDGRWVLALVLARTQDRARGPWRYQLEYLQAPGSRVTRLFWGDPEALRPAGEPE